MSCFLLFTFSVGTNGLGAEPQKRTGSLKVLRDTRCYSTSTYPLKHIISGANGNKVLNVTPSMELHHYTVLRALAGLKGHCKEQSKMCCSFIEKHFPSFPKSRLQQREETLLVDTE